MTHDVFISYKREDEALARPLVKALENSGFSVWWDRDLASGESWRMQIETALDTAKCVIVLWTKNSSGPQGDFVRDEAGRAKAVNTLVPVLREKCRIPLGFGEIQAVDLIRWRGSERNIFFKDLVSAVQAKIDGAPVPSAKGPRQRLIQRAFAGTTMAGLAGGVFAFALNILSVQNHICSVGFLQPGASDLCGSLGLGEKPTQKERLAWARLPPGDCQALRNHVNAFQEGAFRDLATDLISSRSVTTETVWERTSRTLPLYEGQTGDVAVDEASAQADALGRGQKQAVRLCTGFAATTRFQFRKAGATVTQWDCTPSGSGVLCGFEGVAHCELDARKTIEVEMCGGTTKP